jgi:hypothetical protein
MDDSTALIACASTDKFRPQLNGVYFDPTGFAVATDGHRIFGTKLCFVKEHEGKIAKLAPYKASQDVVPIVDAKFASWEKLLDIRFKFAIRLTIPHWISGLKAGKRAVCPIYFSYNDGNPMVSIVRPVDKDYFCLNAKYLLPVAGREMVVRWKDSTNVVLFTPDNKPFQEQTMFYAVMPMRNEGTNIDALMKREMSSVAAGE